MPRLFTEANPIWIFFPVVLWIRFSILASGGRHHYWPFASVATDLSNSFIMVFLSSLKESPHIHALFSSSQIPNWYPLQISSVLSLCAVLSSSILYSESFSSFYLPESLTLPPQLKSLLGLPFCTVVWKLSQGNKLEAVIMDFIYLLVFHEKMSLHCLVSDILKTIISYFVRFFNHFR